MTHNDVVTHQGITYRLADLVEIMAEEQREEIHFDSEPSETRQQWWDRFVERFPESADVIAEATLCVETIWRRMLDCNDVCWDDAGGVVRVRDGQITWYAELSDWKEAALWAETACMRGDYEYAWYGAFCARCQSGICDGGKEPMPLKARYAAGKYDMTSEEGREEALEDVFRGDEDDLADACMLIDMEADHAV